MGAGAQRSIISTTELLAPNLDRSPALGWVLPSGSQPDLGGPPISRASPLKREQQEHQANKLPMPEHPLGLSWPESAGRERPLTQYLLDDDTAVRCRPSSMAQLRASLPPHFRPHPSTPAGRHSSSR